MAPFLVSLTHVAATFYSLSLVVALLKFGQVMRTTYAGIRTKLQDRLLLRSSDPDVDREEARVLIDRFSASSPLRPMDMFDMHYESGASLAGLIFTYVIVLLQFKSSG